MNWTQKLTGIATPPWCVVHDSLAYGYFPILLPGRDVKLEVQMPNEKQKYKSQHAKIGRTESQQGPVSLKALLNSWHNAKNQPPMN